MRFVLVSALLYLFMAAPAVADTVYKCVDAHGRVSYQDTPCIATSRQKVLHFSHAPAAPATAPAPSTTTSVARPPLPPPTPRMTKAPPPVLYRCVRATDGHTYLSRSGHTRPYYVPSNMLGLWQPSLAETYGSKQGDGVGMSAPELATHPTSDTVGGFFYVKVRNRCRRLPPRAACAALRKQNAANEKAIDRAFRSDRGPLLKRRRQLQRRLAGCR